MVITSPTRITIEVTPMQPGDSGHPAVPAQVVVAQVEPNADAPLPTGYQPAACQCLDDEDCAADHEHE